MQDRNATIQARTDAILASDPTLAAMEPRKGKLAHALRAIGHYAFVLTVGGES
jgi:hypothetical protein